MKKSIFIFAALFAATFANAQIYLEKVFEGSFPKWLAYEDYYFDCGKLPIVYGDTLIELYNDDMSLYKSIRFAHTISTPSPSAPARKAPAALKGSPNYAFCMFTRNIFTTDGKVTFIKYVNSHISVYNEDGELVSDLQDSDYSFGLMTVNGKWKLIIHEYLYNMGDDYIPETKERYYVYSLPGNGEFLDVVAPSVPRKSARKVLQNDQVRIENADRTYTLTGQEIK